MGIGPSYNLRCPECGNEAQQPTTPVSGSNGFAFTMPIVYCDGSNENRHSVAEMARLSDHPANR